MKRANMTQTSLTRMGLTQKGRSEKKGANTDEWYEEKRLASSKLSEVC